jgi:hypothetical protein
MAKFGCVHMDHAGFLAIKDELTESLAGAFEARLSQMGDDAKGISWFSSVASEYVEAKRAA